MKILAIETSCDETAVAVLECTGGIDAPRFDVLGNLVLSQADKHAEFGGVYPNLAKREHSENLVPILTQVLKDAQLEVPAGSPTPLPDNLAEVLEREPELFTHLQEYIPHIAKPNIDAIAVTNGPGLEPALWVGVNFARALSAIWDIPIIPTNHMEGHIVSVLIDQDRNNVGSPTLVDDNPSTIQFPALALLVSGGHTQLVKINTWGSYEIIGETRDDAIGEAFDKVARMLDLPYPGGPQIGRLAAEARAAGLESDIKLPRPMVDTDDFDFSYSGLKTAALYAIRDNGTPTDDFKKKMSREFEDAAFDCVIVKTTKALDALGMRDVIVGGGVIASAELRRRLAEISGAHVHLPDMGFTGDNAVMIGAAGYINHLTNTIAPSDALRADGNLRLK